MTRLLVLVLLLGLATPAWADDNPVAQAKEFLAGGDYGMALRSLQTGLRQRGLTREGRGELLLELARFHRDRTGNHQAALRFASQAARWLPKSSPELAEASSLAQRIRTQQQTFAAQDAELATLMPPGVNVTQELSDAAEAEVRAKIDALERLRSAHPDYYRRHEIGYALGVHHLTLREYTAAYDEFSAVLERLPAVYLSLPITTLAEMAHTYAVRSAINGWSWGILAALWIVTAAMFFAAKPWRWATWKHLTAGAALLAVWAVVFYVSFTILGELRPGLENVNQDGRYEIPCYARCDPFSPGSGTGHLLFAYGTAACWGIFLFSMGSTVIRRGPMRTAAQGLYAVLLCGSLLTVYYMRNFESVSIFTVQEGSVLYLAQANLNFEVREPEPWVLTDPLSYPGLDVGGVGDEVFKAWLMRHIPSPRLDPENTLRTEQ